ncbi:TetR/AcrR family transcriptional regulator [Ktedonosporobacter rubrisoli]|uniref:TetR/AcrR family transcriptional regulator n=1 Tax=Ktedonosporobacter rubrisoli TaxID=2509675 RepID=A0A4P6JLG1_KTERU|nr:TetR/AcrR family transcriptional regulator [Ktedonosporobacter rubrisoli]QBD75832.1 TetR/AcrR family transcriptional regulator [Ktedonosporobacter rubrisoli]
MSQEQTDLRVKRSHKLLRDAFIELIAEKRFDEITVGDISARAMVNRATFYRHYQDKYDLVEKIFTDEVGALLRELGTSPGGPKRINPEKPAEAWVKMFERISRHAKLYRALLGHNGSPWFAARLRDWVVEVINERELLRLRKQSTEQHAKPNALPQEAAISLAASLFINAISWWLENEMPCSPRQMASWTLMFFSYGYLRALDLEPDPYVSFALE